MKHPVKCVLLFDVIQRARREISVERWHWKTVALGRIDVKQAILSTCQFFFQSTVLTPSNVYLSIRSFCIFELCFLKFHLTIFFHLDFSEVRERKLNNASHTLKVRKASVLNRLSARYHSAFIGVITVKIVYFSFVNSKDYCCYSQCPYGFVFIVFLNSC